MDGTATFPRNDIENLCKTQVSGAAATLPKGARGIDFALQIPPLEGRGSEGVSENQPIPQSIGEEIGKKLLNQRSQSDVYKLLKQVQDDLFNLLKPTYSPIHLFTYSLRKKAAFTLAEGATHVVHFDKIRRAAFTLAEVLITLGIIGVVAAMTMPSLIQKYQEQKRVTQLKRTMSVLQNAFLMAKNDYGDIQDWGLAITNTGETDDEGNAIMDYSGNANVMNILMKYVHKARLPEGDYIGYVKSLDGREAFWPLEAKDNNYFYLNDGTIVSVGWISSLDCSATVYDVKNRCGDFWIIFPKKSTMKLGVDVFNVALTKDGFKPYYYLRYCNKDEAVGSANSNGRGCSGWVMANGNMDYLRRNVSAE